MSELAKLLPDGNLKIPEEFKEKLGLKAGDLLKVIANSNELILEKLSQKDAERSESLEGILKDITFNDEDFEEAKHSLFKGI